MHKTAAWPLALIYAALVIYASLYPFDRLARLWASRPGPSSRALPRYWTGFDVGLQSGSAMGRWASC
jgi:hypothetical protein